MYRLRATCFYCGKSRLVNSPTSVVRYFKCPNCDAENRFDERGEIEDFAPETPPEKEFVQYAFRASPKQQHSIYDENPICCRDCLHNQALLIKNLAEYLPDESHPDYDNYVANEAAYRRQTEERYPVLCAECAPKVEERIRQSNYKAKTAGLAKMLEKSEQMIKARALHSRVVWGLGMWIKLLLWTVWGAGYLGSMGLLLFWHLCGAIYPMPLDNGGLAPIASWEQCYRESLDNKTLGSACFAISTDWFKIIFPWALMLLPWDYTWLSVKRNPGAYVVNRPDYWKCQAILGSIMGLDWSISRIVSDPKSLERYHGAFLILEILLLWVSISSLQVSWPTKITFKERPVTVAPKQELARMKSLDFPPSPEPVRPTAPTSRSWGGFVPGKSSSNVQTRSQSNVANGRTMSPSFNTSFNASPSGSFNNSLAPSPFRSTSTRPTTATQPNTQNQSFWGSQLQQQPPPSMPYNNTMPINNDYDAMEIDNEPPAQQSPQYNIGSSFSQARFDAPSTPPRPSVHHRHDSNSSDEGENPTPFKASHVTNDSRSSYRPLASPKLKSDLFGPQTGLESLFEAAARLEDPIPKMSAKAVTKVFFKMVVGVVRLALLVIGFTIQFELVGWASAAGMGVALLFGPIWRISSYYSHLDDNTTIQQALKQRRGLLLSVLEVLFGIFYAIVSFGMFCWAKFNNYNNPILPSVSPSVLPSSDDIVAASISDVFSISAATNALNPTTLPSSSFFSPMNSTTGVQLAEMQATITVIIAKLFFLSLLLHQGFEFIITAFRYSMPTQAVKNGSKKQRRSSRDYGISHAVAQPLQKRIPSPLSSFHISGDDSPKRLPGPSYTRSAFDIRPSSANAMVVHSEQQGFGNGGNVGGSSLYNRQQAAPHFGMSTTGVKVHPSGSAFSEGLTLRDRGVNKPKKGQYIFS